MFVDNDNDFAGNSLGSGTVNTSCTIRQINLDVDARWVEQGCFPHRMRYSNNDSLTGATTFAMPFANPVMPEVFFDALLHTTGGDEICEAAGNYVINAASGESSPDAKSDHLFPIDLSQIFTNYFCLLLKVNDILDPDWKQLLDGSFTDGAYVLSSLHGAYYEPSYRSYWQRIALDLISCLVPLAAAVAACWLRNKTLAPDILGYVSSLTLDNPYLDLPNSGSVLPGIERSRLLKTSRSRSVMSVVRGAITTWAGLPQQVQDATMLRCILSSRASATSEEIDYFVKFKVLFSIAS